MSNIIDKIYDNTKDGVPNYSINLIDGRRLYYRGMVLNPLPQSGDAIEYTIINTKTSANGNQYTNIKDVKVATAQSEPINQTPTNNFNKNNTQRLDIFVTGIVGRSMGSGHFSVDDIEKLTKNAVNAFNENLEKL
jgi:hypothetical protein|tara:strand:+ start:276 stop:680 length:405 start_codon:yes stop_codon:yes gene_type:complete